MQTTNGKSKGGRPRKPPTPPVLGVGLRVGDGYSVNVVLAALVVNGKKWEPQSGAELVADMLADGLKRLAAARPAASPIPPVEDPEMASPDESGDGDHHATNDDGHVPTDVSGDASATPEPAMAPGEDTSTHTSTDTSNGHR